MATRTAATTDTARIPIFPSRRPIAIDGACGEPHADHARHRAREDQSQRSSADRRGRPASAHRLAPQEPRRSARSRAPPPKSAAKSWIPRNDGSRCPGRLPSNSFTTPRNCSAPHVVAARLQAISVLSTSGRSRCVAGRAGSSRARGGRTQQNFAALTSWVARACSCPRSVGRKHHATTMPRKHSRRGEGDSGGAQCGETFAAQGDAPPRRRPRREPASRDRRRRADVPDTGIAKLGWYIGRAGTGTEPMRRGAAPPSSTAARPIRCRPRGAGVGSVRAAKASNYTVPSSCAHGFCGVVPRRPWGCMRPSRWDFSGPSSPLACSGSTSSASTPPR